MITSTRELISTHAKQFHETFGVPLSQFYSSDAALAEVLGFDVVKFEVFIDPPEGTSTYDAITAKYGEAAFKMVKSLVLRRQMPKKTE